MEMANLIITDDDLRLIATYELILEKAGHRVVATFSNGRELVDYFQKRKIERSSDQDHDEPDAIILDYRMPHMDGLETAKRLRMLGINLKIILVSAFDLPISGRDFYDTLLRKPVVAGELLEAVTAAQFVRV
jgi:CheY-like chemotaxis protein